MGCKSSKQRDDYDFDVIPHKQGDVSGVSPDSGIASLPPKTGDAGVTTVVIASESEDVGVVRMESNEDTLSRGSDSAPRQPSSESNTTYEDDNDHNNRDAEIEAPPAVVPSNPQTPVKNDGLSAALRAAMRNAPASIPSEMWEQSPPNEFDSSRGSFDGGADGDYHNLGGDEASRRASSVMPSPPDTVTTVPLDNHRPRRQSRVIAQEAKAFARQRLSTIASEGENTLCRRLSKSDGDSLDTAGTADDSEASPVTQDDTSIVPRRTKKPLTNLDPRFRLSSALASEFRGRLGLSQPSRKEWIPPDEKRKRRDSQLVAPKCQNALLEEVDEGMNATPEIDDEPEYEYAHRLQYSPDKPSEGQISKLDRIRTMSVEEVDDMVDEWEKDGLQEFVDTAPNRTASLRNASTIQFSTLSDKELDSLVASWEQEGKGLLDAKE